VKHFFLGLYTSQIWATLPSLVVIFILLFLSTFVQARTIALVYDDSGSMLKNDRWIYANYATQVLAASLRVDDELVSLRMNNGLVRHKSPARIKGWDSPAAGAKTPYTAVEKAMQVIRSAPVNAGTKTVQADEKNWLIITTDGDFDRTATAASVREFFRQTKGQVEVVFLLIGDAVRQTASLWKNISPDQVQIFQVRSGGTDLIAKMNQIATLVAGRDNQEPDGIIRSGRQVRFTSPFPIRRITLLMQQGVNRAVLPNLQKVDFTDAKGTSSVKFTTKEIESRTGKILKVPQKAKVIHCRNNGVTPAGSFTLTFSNQIEQLPLQVLVEAAVDLSVSLYDIKGDKIIPSNGEFAVCDGDPLQIGVKLLLPNSNIPLQLSVVDRNKISVKSLMAGKTSILTYQKGVEEFRSQAKKIDQGVRTLAIEARSPGYFFLKSNVYALRGLPCRRQGVLSFPRTEWKLPYTFSESLEPASASVSLAVSMKRRPYEGPERVDRLYIDGLPRGVELTVNDQHISFKQPVIELPLLKDGQQLKIQIARNREYTAEKPVTVTLRLDSGSWIEWGAPITFQLVPQPRDVFLEVTPLQWAAPVTKMDEQPPVALRLIIDGIPVTAEEFKMWTLTDDHDGYFSLKLKRDDEKTGYTATLRNFFFSPVWTTVGDFSADFTLKGPFPLETSISHVPIHIQWVPWWERARNTVLFFLGLFAFLWWLKRILTKNRFSRSGYVEHFSRVSRRKTPSTTEYLTGNLLLSWVLPTKVEKKFVDGIQFKAGSSESHILIASGQLDNKAKISGLTLETWGSDATQKDQPLNNNDELIISGQRKTEVYRYVK